MTRRILALGTIGALLLAVPALAETSDSNLFVQLLDQAGVPDDVMAEAKTHVARIFAHIGVTIHWGDGTIRSRAVPEPGLGLTVVFASEPMARNIHGESRIVGLALSNEGAGVRRAYVFPDRVARHTYDYHGTRRLRRAAGEGLFLGHVIAHEIGHMMLPRGHALDGIMRARFDAGGIEAALRGTLRFTSGQGALIRANLWSRRSPGRSPSYPADAMEAGVPAVRPEND